MGSQTDRIQGLTGSVALKAPCRVATTTNITLSGLQTIDGVAVVADDRVLVKNQTTSSQNGIYTVSSSAWTRTPDFDGTRDIVKGTLVRVLEGTASAQLFYQVTSATPTEIGTSTITFASVGYLSIPTPGGASDANKFVVTDPTGSTYILSDATASRSLLSAAKSGSNSDITALNVLANINGDQLGACKNKIINGSFDVWQQGSPISVTTSGVYGPDQWRIEADGAGWTRTLTRTGYSGPLDSGMPTRYYLTVAGTVAGTGATFSNLTQPIEGANTLHNGQVTISYWINSDRAFTQNILLRQFFGTGGSPSAIVDTSTTVNLVVGWNFVTKTLTLPDAINGKTYGTNGDDYLLISLGLPLNTTYSFSISNIQVERGSVASRFEVEPFAETLRKCQRYFQKTFPMATAPAQNAGVTGALTYRNNSAAGSNFAILWQFKTEMRVSPTITTYNPSAANASFRNIDLGTDLTVGATVVSPRDVSIEHLAVGMNASHRAQIHATANARY